MNFVFNMIGSSSLSQTASSDSIPLFIEPAEQRFRLIDYY